MLLNQQPRPIFNSYYYPIETQSPGGTFSSYINPLFCQANNFYQNNQWLKYPDMSDYFNYHAHHRNSGSSNGDINMEIKTEQLSPSSMDYSNQDSTQASSDVSTYSKCTV